MTTEIYLHIGRPKTGTTAIQSFLFNNRQELTDNGILYPDCGILDNAHHLVATALLKNLPESIADLPRKDPGLLREELLNLINEYMPEKVMLSSEFFSLMTPANALSLRNNLRDYFKGFPLRVVSYFRSQADYLESSYSQEIKNTKLKKPVDFDVFRKSFLARKVNDYYWSCNNWAEVFGKENIIVRPFEREQLVDGDVVADLLAILDASSLYRKYQQDKKENISLSVPRMMFMNSLAELEIDDEDKNILASALLKIPELPSERGNYRLQDFSMVAQIDDMYRESNAKLAREYLAMDDGILFRNQDQNHEYREPGKEIYDFIHEFTCAIYEADRESYQKLKVLIKNSPNNDSLVLLGKLMKKKGSLLTRTYNYLVRSMGRLH